MVSEKPLPEPVLCPVELLVDVGPVLLEVDWAGSIPEKALLIPPDIEPPPWAPVRLIMLFEPPDCCSLAWPLVSVLFFEIPDALRLPLDAPELLEL